MSKKLDLFVQWGSDSQILETSEYWTIQCSVFEWLTHSNMDMNNGSKTRLHCPVFKWEYVENNANKKWDLRPSETC